MTSAGTFIPLEDQARWRTVDIVTTAIIGVSFGVVFWATFLVYTALTPVLGPAVYVVSGVWLAPAIIAPLIVRRPGAAILAEVLAAVVSAVIGSTWGLDVILSGFVQGAGAELVFALTLYRGWGPVVAMLAAAAAAVGEAVHDFTVYKEFLIDTFGSAGQVIVVVAMLLSGVLVAGFGGWQLVRTLRQTGVLESFPSDR